MLIGLIHSPPPSGKVIFILRRRNRRPCPGYACPLIIVLGSFREHRTRRNALSQRMIRRDSRATATSGRFSMIRNPRSTAFMTYSNVQNRKPKALKRFHSRSSTSFLPWDTSIDPPAQINQNLATCQIQKLVRRLQQVEPRRRLNHNND